jgi:hypothetical protein
MNKCKLFTFVGIVSYGGAVIAQATSASAGPSWEVIAGASLGLLSTLLGVSAMTWTASMSSRIKLLETAHNEQSNYIRDNYVKEPIISREWIELRQKMDQLATQISTIDRNMTTSMAVLESQMGTLLANSKKENGDARRRGE